MHVRSIFAHPPCPHVDWFAANTRGVQAARMVKESAELIKESKDAKKKFVQEEAPMENASKLAAHDHRY